MTSGHGNPAKTQDTVDKLVRFDLIPPTGDAATPVIKQPPPTTIYGQKVFFEDYLESNPPEGTHVEKAVVFVADEGIAEELGEVELGEEQLNEKPSPALPTYPSHEDPEPVQNVPRHPLSQVTNAEDLESPRPSRSQSAEASQQRKGRPAAPVTIILSDSEDKDNLVDNPHGGGQDSPIPTSDDGESEEQLLHEDDAPNALRDEGDGEDWLRFIKSSEEEEEAEEDADWEPDDTFEFRLRK